MSSLLVAGIPVDFTRILQQRQLSGRHAQPLRWLVMGIRQALSAWHPGTILDILVPIIHEGVGRIESGSKSDLSPSWFEDVTGEPVRIVGVGFSEGDCPNYRQRTELLRGCGELAGKQVLRGLWQQLLAFWSHRNFFLLEFGLRCEPYAALFRAARTHSYVTTEAGGFPESPVVALARAMGLRTVRWSYGQNIALWGEEKPLLPAFRWPEVREVWVWSEEIKMMAIQQCEVYGVNFKVTGPLMMGDATSWLTSPPHPSTIGLIDTPPVPNGKSPLTVAFAAAWYKDMHAVVRHWPHWTFLFKEKARPGRFVCPERRALCAEPNVQVLKGTANPWEVVGRSNLVIGMPFASPVVAARAYGRQGLFHDPLGVVVTYPWRDVVMTHGRGDVLRWVTEWIETKSLRPSAYTIPQRLPLDQARAAWAGATG